MSKLATAKATADTPRTTKTSIDPGFEQDLLAAGMEPAKPEAPQDVPGRTESAPEAPAPSIPSPAPDAPEATQAPRMTVVAKLARVQSKLKAPKGQFNKFGGYKYRSCEDILEAVKPLLAEVGAVITITDNLAQVGDRYYVMATARFADTEPPNESVSNTAYAREPEDKKGMDESQITGTASSYARKYALNGLLLIDDTKDADTEENQNERVNRAAAQNGQPQQPQAAKRPMSAPTQDEIETAIQCLEMAESRADVEKVWTDNKARLGTDKAFIAAIKAAGAKFPKDKELK